MGNKIEYIMTFFKNGYITTILDIWSYTFTSLLEEQMKIKGVEKLEIRTDDLMNWFIINGFCDKEEDYYNLKVETEKGEYSIKGRIGIGNSYVDYYITYENYEYKVPYGKTLIINDEGIYTPDKVILIKDKYYKYPSIQFDKQSKIWF